MSSTTIDTSSGMIAESKRRSVWVAFVVRLFREKPLGAVGAVLVLVFLFGGIFSEWIAPYPMNEIHMKDTLQTSSTQYWLGTDSLGRDLLSRVIFGARVSMIVGVAASTIATVISVIIGCVTGLVGGKLDLVVQRFVDAIQCFPSLILLIVVMSIVGPGLVSVIVVLGVNTGIVGSRIVRGAALTVKQNMYVNAAEAIGCSTGRMLWRHILPNVMAPIIILFTTRMPGMILAEASLSFLGFGVPPPTATWGGMITGIAREYMYVAPWIVIWPGVALAIAVYGINMFGDALRDLLDPRLRGGVGRYGTKKAKTGSAAS